MNKSVNDSLQQLLTFCEKENFKGYSLYDSHTGKIPFEKFGKTISFLSNQVVKRSLVNIRPVIGVQKQMNPKGIGLFLHSYCLLKKIGFEGIDNEKLDKQIQYFYNWLKENYSKGWSGICWGYHYDWPRSDGSYFRAHTPSVVVTAYICRGLVAYYELTKDEQVIEIIQSASRFVLNDVFKTEYEEGICFSYTPEQQDTVFNANLLAAEVLAYSDKLSGKTIHRETIKEVLRFTLHHQNENGSWYYSLHPKTGKPKDQIDFHQGYMVETIHRICQISGLEDPVYSESIREGLRFYREKQFDENGASLWRFPKKWPVDIHNQSQGIITFSKFSKHDSGNLNFAEKIAAWTIDNMQGEDGQFYYQKWPLITNKVNYMRWNNCWMLLALVTFLKMSSKEQVL